LVFCFVSSAALCFYCSSSVCSCYCVTEVLVTKQHREKLLQQAASFSGCDLVRMCFSFLIASSKVTYPGWWCGAALQALVALCVCCGQCAFLCVRV
jgi:hypothetical protein